MSPSYSTAVTLLLALYVPHVASGQRSDGTKAGLSTQADYPIAKFVLSPGKPVPGLQKSNVIARPVQCLSSKQLLIEIPMPPTYLDFRLASLSSSGGRFIDFNSIPGMYDRHLLSFFAADGKVVVLFYAADEDNQSDVTMVAETGKMVQTKVNRSPHHTYIVRFDADGEFKSKVQLPSGPQYLKAAEFTSGELLLLSYDRANRAPQLQIADADGNPIKSIPLQGGFDDDNAITSAASGNDLDASRAATAVSSWQMIQARGKILLYSRNAHASLLELGGAGYARQVPVEHPPGYELESFIPSDAHWFAIFRKSETGNLPGGIDSSVSTQNFIMAELNTSDGSIRRLFQMDHGSYFNIACEGDGKFLSYSVDLGPQFLLSSTDVPK